MSQKKHRNPKKTHRLNKEGTVVEVAIISTALINESGDMHANSTTERARVPVRKQPPHSTS